MRIDFHEKMSKKLEEKLNKVSSGILTDEFNVAVDEATLQSGDEIREEIATKVWHMEDKERVIEDDMKRPEKISNYKAQTYANHFAREEMEAMEKYLQIMEMQMRSRFLFKDMDMDMVRQAIYNPVKGIYFDKNDDVKPEYVDIIINDYAERLEAEALLGEEMHLI